MSQEGDEDDGLKEKKTGDDMGSSIVKSPSPNASVSMNESSSKGVGNSSGIDAHPFVRGSVIEVLYQENDVRLCDIIDRALDDSSNSNNNNNNNNQQQQQWQYYIHYRDFNRRMDEWISIDRIVSPPSVGNAKVRKQQQSVKKQRLEVTADPATSSTRPSRSSRRASFDPTATATASVALTSAAGGASSALNLNPAAVASSTHPSFSSMSALDADTTRLTRRQRRRGRSAAEEASNATSSSSRNGLINVWQQDGNSGAAEDAAPNSSQEGVVWKDQVVTVAAQELDEHEGLDEASLREHEEVTKVKNVQSIELGRYKMDTWYFSPIPSTLQTKKMVNVLYVCEFTFSFFVHKSQLLRFQSKLPIHKRHPPGNEIYRHQNLSMFEIDGNQERLYCQNLCYIAKLFLDHKTLYFDVDPFLFYVLCEVDNRGFHPVGYYSKEKYSDVGYNLACILTFPCHQRKGYGRFLISFSYELTKKEEKVGSPEKPMSDLGQQAYKPYWTSTIIDFLLHHHPLMDNLNNTTHDSNHADQPQQPSSTASSMSIMDISKVTSIMAEDIIFTLNQLGILKYINGVYFIAAEQSLLEELAKKHPIKEPRVDPTKLHWSPYITDVKRDKFSIHSKKKSDTNNTTTNTNSNTYSTNSAAGMNHYTKNNKSKTQSLNDNSRSESNS